MGNNKTKILTVEELNYLKQHTRFDEATIKDWHTRFQRDCPNGQLTPETFILMYKRLFPKGGNARKFCEPVFKTFDTDKSGFIDFKEFMLAMDMTTAGTPEEKLMWAFKMYDDDGNGVIDVDEMTKIIQTLYDMLPTNDANKTIKITAKERSQRIFAKMDKDGNGELNQQEFLQGCLKDKELTKILMDQARDAKNVFSLLL